VLLPLSIRTCSPSSRAMRGPLPRARRRGVLAALVAGMLLLTHWSADAQPPPPPSGHGHRPAPMDPDGAWAGYSIDGARGSNPSQSRREGEAEGMDVSSHQGDVNWPKAWADGARFAYVKSTEGNHYRSRQFAQHYNGAHDVGMIRGAYHFALPDRSTGAVQAHYFVDNGGGWASDGRTLPGALDLERNPYGDACYGLSPEQMSQWIADFNNTYKHRTGRVPVMYTNTTWWNQCTGANPDFGMTNPLWVASYGPEIGPLPAGWEAHTIWQHSSQGVFPGDQNTFNGNQDQLARFAERATGQPAHRPATQPRRQR
jgi:GH25 family lysozyme M1 (1,4-beta-N-acetylmuramidase)